MDIDEEAITPSNRFRFSPINGIFEEFKVSTNRAQKLVDQEIMLVLSLRNVLVHVYIQLLWSRTRNG